MTKRFVGKIAVVTGGSTGIGLAIAKRFVQEGMEHVFITGRGKGALDAAAATIGKNVTAHVAMPGAKEPLENGLYSKFHNFSPWRFVLQLLPTSCTWSKRSEELPVYLLLGGITLAALLQPRGAERVEHEGIPLQSARLDS